jgi:hypothetical protein
VSKVGLEKKPATTTFPAMSITQLKEAADRLTPKESSWLRAYLAAKARSNDPVWRTEMARRLKRMRAGHEISSDEYYKRTRALDRTAAAVKRKAA